MHPAPAAALHSFQQAGEDVEFWTRELSDAEVWLRPLGLAAAGFQLRHIAGSIDRLLTYAAGGMLNETQMNYLKLEAEPGATRASIVEQTVQALQAGQSFCRELDPETLALPREVGRKKLPTTVGGLLIHTAEHAQRHVGQLIVTVRVIRALRVGS